MDTEIPKEIREMAIKRRDTLRGLLEIFHGRARSEYAQRLLPIVSTRWQQIYTNPWSTLD